MFNAFFNRELLRHPEDSGVAEALQKWPLRLVVIGLAIAVISTLLLMFSDLPLRGTAILLEGPGLVLTLAFYLGITLLSNQGVNSS